MLSVPAGRKLDLGLDFRAGLVKVEVVRYHSQVDPSGGLAVAIQEIVSVSDAGKVSLADDLLVQSGRRQSSVLVRLSTHVPDNHLQPFGESRDGDMSSGTVQKVIESVVGRHGLIGVCDRVGIVFGSVKFWNPVEAKKHVSETASGGREGEAHQ